MDIVFLLLIVLVCFFSITVTFAIIPYISRKDLSFGIGMPEKIYYDSTVKKIRDNYRNGIILLGAVSTLLIILLTLIIDSVSVSEYIFTPVVLIQLAGNGYIYLRAYGKMKALKKESGWKNDSKEIIVVDTEFRNRKIAVSPLWFILYPIVMLGTLGAGMIFYDNMPEKVPMNFDFSGQAAGWVDKSYKLIFFAPVIQLFMAILFVFIYFVISKSKQQIDSSDPETSLEQNRIFRYRWSAFIVFGGMAMLLVFSFVQLTITGIVQNSLLTLFVPIALVVLIVGAVIVLSVTTGQSGSRVRISINKKTGETVNRNDDKYWKLGSLYYNPDDPAVFVEKRFGIGWTNNWARPVSWIMIAGFLVLIIGLVLLTGNLMS